MTGNREEEVPIHVPHRDSNTERKVGIGGISVIARAGTLRTLLGSCIGVVLHDAKKQVGGMAHVVLPHSEGTTGPIGKYANLALPELIRQIQFAGGCVQHLVAKLAGGAKMFPTASSRSIGDDNLAVVEQLLGDARIPICGHHCGGTQGRRMSYDVATGIVLVEVVGSEVIQL